MKFKLYYTQKMVVDADSFSKSPLKPKLVMEAALKEGLPIEIIEPVAATLDDFAMAHKRSWAKKILEAKLPNGFGTRDKNLSATLPFTTGAAISASLEALKNRSITFANCSGFHHVGYSDEFGGANRFCSLNGLIVAAQRARQFKPNCRVLILDLDQHESISGCGQIIEHLKLNFITLYSFGAHDINRSNSEVWLKTLPSIIKKAKPDVVIAQLAADAFELDPLSHSHLTKDQLYRRDLITFQTCKALNVGCAVVSGGGYSDPFSHVLEIHLNSIRAAKEVYGK